MNESAWNIYHKDMAFWKLLYSHHVAVFSYTYQLLHYTHLSIQYEIFRSFNIWVFKISILDSEEVWEGQIKVEAFLDIRLLSWLDGSSSSILSIFAIFWTCWSEIISLDWTMGWFCWSVVVRGWIGVGTVGLFEFSGFVGLWWILVPYNGFSGSKSGR